MLEKDRFTIFLYMIFRNRKKLKDRIAQVKYSIIYSLTGSEIVRYRQKTNKLDSAIDELVKFYRGFPKLNKPKLDKEYDTLSSISKGVGDSVCGSAFYHVAAKQNKKRYLVTRNPYHKRVNSYNTYFIEGEPTIVFPTEDLGKFETGNGHLINRFQRALGLKTDPIPKTCLKTNLQRVNGKVAFNFSTGKSAFFKNNYYAPRQLVPEQAIIFQRFINEHKELEFVEVDQEFHGFKNTTNRCRLNINQTIEELSTCEWYIGLNSGPLHLAAGLGLNLIQVVNIPHAHNLYLPILRTNSTEDAEWLYPQAFTLHRNDEHGLVKMFSQENLNRAINKEIYPYDCQELFCNLINLKEFV